MRNQAGTAVGCVRVFRKKSEEEEKENVVMAWEKRPCDAIFQRELDVCIYLYLIVLSI